MNPKYKDRKPAYDKKYNLIHKEEIKKRHQDYYQKNKEKIKKRVKSRAMKKKKEIKLKKKIRYEKNKKQVLAKNRGWYKNNKEKWKKYIKQYNVKRRKVDLNFSLRHCLRSRLYVVLKKFGNGKELPANKYGINYKKIIQHLKPFPKNRKKYQVDHIIPLCSFDLTDPKQIKTAFAPENHQWLTIEQNKRKAGSLNWQEE